MATNETTKASFRIAMSLVGILIMAMMIWTTSRAALASRYNARAAKEASISHSEKAVALNESDPDAHLVRGAFLEANDDLASAIFQYERAIKLRPQDYVLWLTLARARELNGEREKAIAAARMAVPCAPSYAQPHWQLGNLLLRGGQTDEAFNELRLAVASNPLLQQAVMDLVWQLTNGNAQLVKDIIRPADAATYTSLGEYFKRRGQIEEATAMFEAAGNDSRAVTARNQFVGELIAARKFLEAQKVWRIGRARNARSDEGVIVNGEFEHETNLDEPGFNWRRENVATSIGQSLDSADPHQGRASLRIDFNGNSDPNTAIISQLVLIAPNTHYLLQFAVRAEAIVSGGLPLVTVTDAGDGTVLGQLDLSPTATTWGYQKIEFATAASTSAIRIALQRKPCSAGPCPIFGRLWLDDVSLQKP